MIKICSLDFLNREIFETDIMTAEGEVLFHSGEEITPSALLRLYFKEIYIEQPLAEKVQVSNEANSAVLVSAADKVSLQENVNPIENVQEQSNVELVAVAGNLTVEKEVKGKDSKLAEASFDLDGEGKGPKLTETGLDFEGEGKGPRLVETGLDLDEEGKGPRLAETSSGSEEGKGPKSAGMDFDSDEEDENTKGPRFVGSNKFDEDENEGIDKLSSEKSRSVDSDEEDIQEEPEDEYLKFDEEQAKRIVQHSVKLGKILDFSDKELKEIELVAYNCNIGITKFKKEEAFKKGFRKKKAFASYEKLLEDGVVSAHIAEMVKFCVNTYESDAFELNSKIPYYHIVALSSFYEDLFSHNQSKNDTLLKMLQMGGNQFNIFILHKFIRMMREADE